VITQEIINEVRKIVEEQCKSKENIYGYGAWKHHINIVVKYSKILAKKMGGDIEIVELAALLHDYASVKDYDLYKDHHIHSSNLANKILSELEYPSEKIEQVKKCIYSHRASMNIRRNTIEEICVSSADAMAHIDQIPSLLHLAYVSKGMDIDEGAKWVCEKIERSWEKLCDEAKEIIKDKYCSSKIILNSRIYHE